MNRQQITSTYEDIVEIGSGGGGTVYRAFHKRLQKYVVLKKIHNVTNNVAMMRKEVDILKNLQHSFIPQVLDFLEVDGAIYTVMSFISGKSLQAYIDEGRVFTQKELVRYGVQLCSALSYLHQQNPPIIHSDIKPANIMLTDYNDICLIDYNISFYLNENVVIGYSGGYTSPELFLRATNREAYVRQGHVVDQKSDIYSLGATLYYLATREKILDYNKGANIDHLEQITSKVLACIIDKAVRTNGKERFQTALQMQQAFQNMNKKDARYKALRTQQSLWCITMCVAFIGSVVLSIGGFYELRNERYEKYNQLVEEQQKKVEEGDVETVFNLYKEAVELLPEGAEAYYQAACSLFQEKEYEECIQFVQNDIVDNPHLEESKERVGEIYYVGANAYYEQKQYKEAVEWFEKAQSFGMKDCEFYRDYAISLAYVGDITKAQAVLEQAIAYGLTEDSIYYATGEMAYAVNNHQEALEAFQKSRACSDNEYMKMRAYVMESTILEEENKDLENRELLLEASTTLTPENQLSILERLIRTDLTLGDMQGDSIYLEEAVQTSEKIVANGWATYTTYNNLAILNQKLGQYQTAYDTLETMKELFGEDYNLYKRYAFLEISNQELVSNENRDYSDFKDYYEAASRLYEEELENNNTDPEMQLLTTVFQQVKEGGWLK